MSIRKSVILFGVALSMAAFMSGCSSSTKEGGSPADVQKVGDTKCFQCHAATADPLTGETFIEQYTRSLHAELGCESCHGGGAQHNGIGPFPFTLNSEISDAKKAERCAMCHDGVTEFTTKSGELVKAPLSSSINFSNGNHANPFGPEEEHRPLCARCHSHEGSILYGKAGFTGDASILVAANQPVLARDPETFNPIRCATCHEHGGNIRQTNTRDAAVNGNIVAWDPDGSGVTGQFDLCTSCHTMNTNAGVLIGSGNTLAIANTAGGTTNVATAPFFHNTRWFRTLPSTHVDQAASGTTATGTLIEGYVIRKNHKNPCYECHGHEFKANTRAYADHPERGTTIFTDWAKSGHAGKILLQKVAAANANAPAAGLSGAALTNAQTAQVDAVMKAGVDDTSGIAWSHYNWDSTLLATGVRDRGDCQMCHTSTGFANYADDPTTYNPDNNDFSHLSGWKAGTAKLGTAGTATTASGQNELLYCWGCHSNAGAGKLRSTGSATISFQLGGQPIVIKNIGNSAACVVCHGGRGSVGALTAADTRSSRFQGHHAPTAGIVFAAQTHLAFEYPGQDYINAAFRHDQINASTDGPCASCHMANKVHTFKSVSTAGGVVQKIYAQTLCDSCHGTYTPATLADGKAGYAQATTLLNNLVGNKANFANYLNVAITANNINTKDAAGNFVIADEAYGAFQNGLLNGDEPCGYVHNPTYTKRVIFDSIDWMDNGRLDGTITIDAATFPKAAAWLGVPAGGTVKRP
jgi:Cytochrome c554 and c-prime